MQTSKVRPEPKIPDHEVLRKIGGGAYGEVWLARGVTGALRAVKTVWHNDFDDERGFEREFEGILKYEPISRDHPGLVHILHVGRSEVEGEPFYYYVMELGDDVVMRRDINPVEYEPRTLRSDMKAAEGKALDVEECITVGRLLAEGLHHLHKHGLAHRDVKPSNVIFVDGKAKLADIGLVALGGQQTFVGTEGFVPPEGPGSTQADVYSLGKVLYEMATGKDRLDFPELPEELPEGPKLKRWRLLNSVICDVCEPRISRRKIQTAGELAAEFARLEAGRRRPVRVRPGVVAGLLATAAGVVGAGQILHWEPKEIASTPATVRQAVPVPMGEIQITSEPQNARVFDPEGQELGMTPTTQGLKYPIDSIVKLTLKLKGYRDKEVTIEVNDELVKVMEKLAVYRPPEVGTEWADVFGTVYSPENDMHVSRYFVSAEDWQRFLDATDSQGGRIVTVTENGMERDVVIATEEEARYYTKWLEAQCGDEYLEDGHWIEPRIEKIQPLPEVGEVEAKRRRPFWCVVRKHNEASTFVSTNPPGADIYLDGEKIGTTRSQPGTTTSAPFEIAVKLGKGVEMLKPDLVIEKQGYRRVRPDWITLVPDQHDPVEMAFTVNLEPENILSHERENSLGMKFVPVGNEKNLLVSIWETRVRDYAAYVRASKGEVDPPPKPDFEQGDDHPVVNVSKEDAEGFCRWLTEKEHRSGDLEDEYEYRLPTDAEWSMLVGLEEPSAEWPWQLNGKIDGFYWGNAMSLPPDVGNFADESTGHPENKIIEYIDGQRFTAPVGAYSGRSFGEFEIYDLEGNVLEWVSDDYDRSGDTNVARGAGFRSYEPAHLQKSARWWVPKSASPRDDNGFRVVLAKVPAKTEKEPAETLDEGSADDESGQAAPDGAPENPSPEPKK